MYYAIRNKRRHRNCFQNEVFSRYRYRLEALSEFIFTLRWCSSACGVLATAITTDTEFDRVHNAIFYSTDTDIDFNLRELQLHTT